MNELEILGVVWAIVHFKRYCSKCALLTIMKNHRSNKSYNSGLKSWVDDLLPFKIDIEHLPDTLMELVDDRYYA